VTVQRGRGEELMAPNTWGQSKGEVRYKPSPQPQVACKECMWMFPRLARGSCKYVRGIIEATATCDLFEPRKRGSV
jgi:hypothetical protein